MEKSTKKAAKKAVPASEVNTHEELEAINKAQEEEIKSLLKENENLKKVATKASKGGGRPINTQPKEFDLEGKKYSFPAPKFSVPKVGTFTAEEALKNPEVLQKLVELGSAKPV